jgi:peptidoglycan/LPS O-acetylase OafA/YrhL
VTEHRRLAYQPALDGLRALAVGAVIAYHLNAGWARGGFLGVDAFFVLSGYLITSLLLGEWRQSGTIKFAAFWGRRARRLLPALLLVLTAVAIYAATSVPATDLGQLRGDGLATLFYGANWRFIVTGQSYFTLYTAASPLRHMWSLAIEEQFYLVWPLVAFACLRLVRGRRWLLAAVCALGTVGSALVMAAVYNPADPSRAYYGTDSRAQLLLVGCLFAIVLNRWTPRAARARATVSVAGIAGLAYCAWAWVAISDHAAWMYRGGYLLFGVAVVAVIAAVVQPDRPRYLPRALLSLPPVVWVGRISYGLYLWHWPVIVYVTADRVGVNGWQLALLRVGLTFATATLSFYLVELPIRTGRFPIRRLRLALPAAFAGAGLAIVLATVNAAPLPAYLRQNTDVLAAARRRPLPPRTPAASAPVTPATPHRILLMGDSVAGSLFPGLQHVAYMHGIQLTDGSFAGCGLVTGSPLDPNGQKYPWSDSCSNALPFIEDRAMYVTNPDVVLWISGAWDERDRVVNGQTFQIDNPTGQNVLLRLIGEAAHRFTKDGARLVIVTLPPETFGTSLAADPARNQRQSELNAVLHRFAWVHNIQVVDLATIVCPNQTCQEVVDHRELRPDGYHFDSQASEWVAERLIPEVLNPGASPPASIASASSTRTTR